MLGIMLKKMYDVKSQNAFALVMWNQMWCSIRWRRTEILWRIWCFLHQVKMKKSQHLLISVLATTRSLDLRKIWQRLIVITLHMEITYKITYPNGKIYIGSDYMIVSIILRLFRKIVEWEEYLDEQNFEFEAYQTQGFDASFHIFQNFQILRVFDVSHHYVLAVF